MPQATCISNFKFLASQEVLLLLEVFAVSVKESKGTVPDSCKDDFDKFFIINHLVRPKGTCIQNFRFLAGREVLRIEISSFC